jgi:hypothetical protein
MRDITHNIDPQVCLLSQVVSTTPDPDGADLQECNSVDLELNMGDSGDTLSGSVYITLILQDSADDSTWAAVTEPKYAVPLSGTTLNTSTGAFALIDAPAEDSRIFRIGYIGPKRYARILPALTGTHTNGVPISITGVRGDLDMNVI